MGSAGGSTAAEHKATKKKADKIHQEAKQLLKKQLKESAAAMAELEKKKLVLGAQIARVD